jgi:hypothetical protein
MVPAQSGPSAADSSPSLDRRSALKSLSAMGAGVLTTLGLAHSTNLVAAQDATPESVSETEDTKTATMFVQLALGGSWMPKPDEDGVYLLTMAAPSNQTIFFSDRPDRIVGAVGTDTFLDQLGFTPSNPPNAAAVVNLADGTRDVLIIELFNPVYTQSPNGDLLTYEARVLTAYEGDGLSPWVGLPDDDQLPPEFNEMTLFIDDCGDISGCCLYRVPYIGYDRWVGPLPGGPFGSCYWFPFGCYSCRDDRNYYDGVCRERYPNKCYNEVNFGLRCYGC